LRRPRPGISKRRISYKKILKIPFPTFSKNLANERAVLNSIAIKFNGAVKYSFAKKTGQIHKGLVWKYKADFHEGFFIIIPKIFEKVK
jgi:hypothetical protein